jgi:hypothetical protein
MVALFDEYWKKSKAFYQRLRLVRRVAQPALPFLQGG